MKLTVQFRMIPLREGPITPPTNPMNRSPLAVPKSFSGIISMGNSNIAINLAWKHIPMIIIRTILSDIRAYIALRATNPRASEGIHRNGFLYCNNLTMILSVSPYIASWKYSIICSAVCTYCNQFAHPL